MMRYAMFKLHGIDIIFIILNGMIMKKDAHCVFPQPELT